MITNREWMFGAAGILIGYVLIPQVFHQAGISLKNVTPPGKCSGKCKTACFRCSGSNQIGLCQDSGCPPKTIQCSCITGKALSGQGNSGGTSLLGSIANGIGSLFKGAPVETPVA